MPHTSRPDVLLVVDMQNGFLGPRSAHVIPIVSTVLAAFHDAGIPIVCTRFHNRPNSPYERLIGWTRLRTETEVALHDAVAPMASWIIDKDIYTAFTPDFVSLVQQHGWHTVAICGVATDGCVLKTSVDAFERDLIPIVIADACASHAGDEIHQAGLTLLRRFIGRDQIVTTADVLSTLA